MVLVEHRALLGSKQLDMGNVGLTLLQLNTFISWEGHASGLVTVVLAARIVTRERRGSTPGQAGKGPPVC